MTNEPFVVWILGMWSGTLGRETEAEWEKRVLAPGAGLLHRFSDGFEPEPLRQKPKLRIVK